MRVYKPRKSASNKVRAKALRSTRDNPDPKRSKRKERVDKTILPNGDSGKIQKRRSYSSYIDMLIDSVGSDRDRGISAISLSLHSAILSSSQKSRDASYLIGIPIGRLIYNRARHRPHETLYESLQALTEFIDMTGHITAHHTLSHQIVFHLYGDDRCYIGVRSHNFEAGIISGFVSSAMHKHINIVEESCRLSGNDKCVLVSQADNYQDNSEIDRPGISCLIRMGVGEHGKRNASYAYDSIMLSTLEDSRISSSAYSTAKMIGSVLRELASNIRGPSNKMNYILDGIRLFGIGEPRFDKDYIYLELRREVSRMSVVRLAAALLAGILDREPLAVDTRMARGRYTIRVRRRA